jgi:hypothetical protein
VKANEEFLLLVKVKNVGNAKGNDINSITIPAGWASDSFGSAVTLDVGEETVLQFKIVPNEASGKINAFSSSNFKASDMIKPEATIVMYGIAGLDFSGVLEGLNKSIEDSSKTIWA